MILGFNASSIASSAKKLERKIERISKISEGQEEPKGE